MKLLNDLAGNPLKLALNLFGFKDGCCSWIKGLLFSDLNRFDMGSVEIDRPRSVWSVHTHFG